MNIIWLALPFQHGDLIWPLGKAGMRNTISLENSFGEVLNDTPLSITIGDRVTGLYIPTGLISTPLAMLFGFLTGKLFNSMKGSEMIAGMVLGYFVSVLDFCRANTFFIYINFVYKNE